MEKMMYLAAQYLAAAGISFLEKKDDDSHTNLEFVVDNANLNTRALNQSGSYLSLNYERFTMAWIAPESTSTIRLDGASHSQILQWIGDNAAKNSLEYPYAYKFHYDLPYSIENNFTFKLLNSNRLSELTHLRILAQLVLEKFLNDNNLNSEIRIWPHHFDTGAFAKLNTHPEMAVGLGMAIPDAVVNEHYFYISVYGQSGAIVPNKAASLSQGLWHSNGFKGAVLPAKDATVQSASGFLQEALESLIK